jgi:hypothetical protein
MLCFCHVSGSVMVHHHFPWSGTVSEAQTPASDSSKDEQATLLGKRIIVFCLLLVTVFLTKPSSSPNYVPQPSTPRDNARLVKELKLRNDPPPTAMAREIVSAHNKYRLEVGVPPLAWSNTLASHAMAWAKQLASENAFKHDDNNLSEGENIWMGTGGYYSYTQMTDSFGSEKHYYVPGTFPNISKTGSWGDVGHYTQMICPETTHVGCAGASGSDGKYRLVCRYYPPGNITGYGLK